MKFTNPYIFPAIMQNLWQKMSSYVQTLCALTLNL